MRESEVFAARAAECRVEADTAELDNVRERCLRAGDAWSAMADRSRRTESARATREAAAEAARVEAVLIAGAGPEVVAVEVAPELRAAMPLR